MTNSELTKIMVEKATIKIRTNKSPHFLATATVKIGLIEIKGWTIAQSDLTTYHVLPPRTSFKSYIVFINDPDLFSCLIGKITSAYEKWLSENDYSTI